MPVGLMRLWIKTSFSLSNSFAKFSTPLRAIIFPYKLVFVVLMLLLAALPLPVVAVLAVAYVLPVPSSMRRLKDSLG